MKNLLCATALVLVGYAATAQKNTSATQTDTTTLNSLKAPSSPVAKLLGFSANDITSIQEKTKFEAEVGKLFTNAILPKSFGFSFAPFKLRDNKNKYWQDLSLSVGYADSTEINLLKKRWPKSSQLGIGFSWSFIGKRLKNNPYLTKKTQERNNESYKTYLENYSTKRQANYSVNLKTMLNSKADTSKQRTSNVIDPLVEIMAANEDLKDARKTFFKEKNIFQFFNGWAFDASGGAVWSQYTRDLDQYGFWLTASWSPWEDTDGNKDKEHQHSFLAVARLLKNGKNSAEFTKEKDNIHFDYGFKYAYHIQDKSRFYIESEFLFRTIDSEFTSDKLKYKTDVSMGYEINKNFIISASFGRDFGGKVYNKSGNLFALLNVIGALGAKK